MFRLIDRCVWCRRCGRVGLRWGESPKRRFVDAAFIESAIVGGLDVVAFYDGRRVFLEVLAVIPVGFDSAVSDQGVVLQRLGLPCADKGAPVAHDGWETGVYVVRGVSSRRRGQIGRVRMNDGDAFIGDSVGFIVVEKGKHFVLSICYICNI